MRGIGNKFVMLTLCLLFCLLFCDGCGRLKGELDGTVRDSAVSGNENSDGDLTGKVVSGQAVSPGELFEGWNGKHRLSNGRYYYVMAKDGIMQCDLTTFTWKLFKLPFVTKLLYVDENWLYCMSKESSHAVWKVPLKRTEEGEMIRVRQAEIVINTATMVGELEAEGEYTEEEYDELEDDNEVDFGYLGQIYIDNQHIALEDEGEFYTYIYEMDKIKEKDGKYECSDNVFFGDIGDARDEQLMVYEEEKGYYCYNMETDHFCRIEDQYEKETRGGVFDETGEKIYYICNEFCGEGDGEVANEVQQRYGIKQFSIRNEKRNEFISYDRIRALVESKVSLDYDKKGKYYDYYEIESLFIDDGRLYLHVDVTKGDEIRFLVMSVKLGDPDSLRMEENINRVLDEKSVAFQFTDNNGDDYKVMSGYCSQIQYGKCYLTFWKKGKRGNFQEQVYCYDIKTGEMTPLIQDAPVPDLLFMPYYDWNFRCSDIIEEIECGIDY